MPMERFTVSMSETDIDLFERKRADMGMTKSAFIRFLIAEHDEKVPSFIKNKEVIEKMAELNTLMKEMIISDKLSEVEKLHLFEQIKRTNEIVEKKLK